MEGRMVVEFLSGNIWHPIVWLSGQWPGLSAGSSTSQSLSIEDGKASGICPCHTWVDGQGCDIGEGSSAGCWPWVALSNLGVFRFPLVLLTFLTNWCLLVKNHGGNSEGRGE